MSLMHLCNSLNQISQTLNGTLKLGSLMENKKLIQRPLTKTQRSTIDCGKSLTEQSHKDQCDMNVILRDYQRTGMLKHAKEHEGKYDDVSAQDFQEAMFLVANAKNMFQELPSSLRSRFQNDPAQFLSFAQNPASKAELESMGIIRGNDGLDINGAITQAPTANSPKGNETKGATSSSDDKTQAPTEP